MDDSYSCRLLRQENGMHIESFPKFDYSEKDFGKLARGPFIPYIEITVSVSGIIRRNKPKNLPKTKKTIIFKKNPNCLKKTTLFLLDGQGLIHYILTFCQ
jgi:hypothetical protein